MPRDPSSKSTLRELQEQLRCAHAVTPDLMTDAIVRSCPRLQARHSMAEARVARLIENGAFVDAALALIELELPQWKLRRLVCDDGLWHCSLSKEPGLPIDLDQTADMSHEILALALLGAFLDARCDTAATATRSQSVPQFRPMHGLAVCCDNFA